MAPEGWRRSPLGEVAHIVMGQSPPGDAYNSAGEGEPLLNGPTEFGVVHPTPIQWTTTPTKFAETGDVLFCVRGSTTGRQNVSDRRYCIGRGLAAIRGLRDLSHTPFLRHVLAELAEAVLMEARGSGSTFPNITSDRLTAQLVALPSLPEQRKIAAILSSVDEAIEGTQAVIDQLQVVKKAMMADLLTRGIPGRHKKFKQTEIGEVPEDWEVVPMGTVATIGNGSTPSKARPDYWDGGTIPWLPTGKVNDYIIRTADSFVTEKALAECPIRLLPRGTVLVAMIGQGKTRGMVAYLDVEATINQNFAYVAPGAAVRSWFLFAFLNHVYGELRGSGRGSNQDALNCGILKAFPVPVPQVDEQEMIARGCFALDERIIREADAVSGLLELKSALMSVLLTGEVRVRVDEESAA